MADSRRATARSDSPLLQAEAPSGSSYFPGDGAEGAVSAATQTAVLADAAVQCEPLAAAAALQEAAVRRQLLSPELARFLCRATPHCEEALQQNELADALVDELAALVDEDGAEGGTSGGTGSSGGGSTAAGVVEHQSFSDLLHSKDRPLVAAQWHPSRRGVVGVACMQGSASNSASQQQPATAAARHRQPPTGCILVWNHTDAIHPEAVLQAPADVLAFAFHPAQPHWVAAGLGTGQVALFNLQQQPCAAGAAAAAAGGAGQFNAASAGHHQQQVAAPQQQQQGLAAAGGMGDDGRDEGGKPAALLPAFVSLPEASHQAGITDLQWLPGVVVTRDGRLEAALEGDCCNLFATTAADGALLLWDMRITTRQRKAAKEEEQPDWKPALALGAASTSKQPLPATRFCIDQRCGLGRFLLGSLEGEVVAADAASYSQERRGNLEWAHNTVQQVVGHAGRITALAFSPFFSDGLLTVGDWGFVVWRIPSATAGTSGGNDAAEDSSGGSNGSSKGGSGSSSAPAYLPVFESPFSESMYTCGCWSPSKPGVVLLGRQDGRLEAWDLVDRTHQAALVAPISPTALTTLAVSPAVAAGSGRAAAQLLAVGDAAGMLRLLELPRTLRRRGHAEVKAMAALLEHEQRRLAAAAQRAQVRAAEQQQAEERRRAEAAAAAQGAVRSQHPRKQEQAQGGDADAEVVQGPDSAERRYLELEAQWRERLVVGGGGSTAPVASA